MTLISDTPRLVVVFGGSGFIGRHVVRVFAGDGWRVRVAVRRPDLATHLQPLGGVGQIVPVQANLRSRDTVAAAVDGADAVVNLVGIMGERGRQTHAALHALGARLVAEAAKAAGVARLVHMSAIGAAAGSPSSYARSKADGEAAVLDVSPEAIVLRPSVVFGPEDGFFNLFAGLVGLSPVLPLIGGGETPLQPVYAGDVAEAVARIVEGAVAGKATPGAVYELGGPEVLSLADCVRRAVEETGRRRVFVKVPFGMAAALARLFAFVPGMPMTPDAVELLRTPNVVSAAAIAEGRTFAGLGIEPRSLATILPTYLYRFRRRGQFDRFTPTNEDAGASGH